jgi:hypothetical protein
MGFGPLDCKALTQVLTRRANDQSPLSESPVLYFHQFLAIARLQSNVPNPWEIVEFGFIKGGGDYRLGMILTRGPLPRIPRGNHSVMQILEGSTLFLQLGICSRPPPGAGATDYIFHSVPCVPTVDIQRPIASVNFLNAAY